MDADSWRNECIQLTQTMIDSDDSAPFRQPVDPIDVPVSFLTMKLIILASLSFHVAVQ